MKHTTHSLAEALLKQEDKPVCVSAMDVNSEHQYERYFGDNIVEILDGGDAEVTICVDVESNEDYSK